MHRVVKKGTELDRKTHGMQGTHRDGIECTGGWGEVGSYNQYLPAAGGASLSLSLNGNKLKVNDLINHKLWITNKLCVKLHMLYSKI